MSTTRKSSLLTNKSTSDNVNQVGYNLFQWGCIFITKVQKQFRMFDPPC